MKIHLTTKTLLQESKYGGWLLGWVARQHLIATGRPTHSLFRVGWVNGGLNKFVDRPKED